MANTIDIQKDGRINISNWQEGVGQSSLDRYADMLGVNIFDNPGQATVNYKFNKLIETRAGITFTADAGTDAITPATTITYRGIYDYQAVRLTTTGTLPAGLALNTTYYVKGGFGGSSVFFLATSLKNAIDGTFVDITGTGTGVHTLTLLSPSIIKGKTRDSNGNIYILDSNQRVWFCNTNSTNIAAGVDSYWYLLEGNTSAGTGNGIIFYKGYILVWGTSKIDALHEINSIGTALAWHNDFASAVSISSSTTFPQNGACPFLSINDDAIYFANGNPSGKGTFRVGLLEEVAGEVFDPVTTSTFSCVPDVTVIPNLNGLGYVTAIKEIGEQLIIGTGSDQVFVWDKKSPAFTNTYKIPETLTRFIEVVGNEAYLFSGINGNVYVANTVSYAKAFRLPEQLSNQYYQPDLDAFGSVAINYTATNVKQNELLFAVEIYGYCYLMSYNLDTKKLVKKNISSFGERLQSTTNGLTGNISLIFNTGDNILIGSYYRNVSGSSYSYALESLLYTATIGTPTSYFCYDNYEANILTQLIPYGDEYAKRTTKEIKISLMRALATGQGVKVSYRLDDTSSWTLLTTFDYATYGAKKDIKLNGLITNIIDLQIKVEMAGSGQTSPRLKLISLIP